MNWTINGTPLSATLAGRSTGNSFSASATTCSPSCSVNADIMVFGANAARAGMTYDISNPSLPINGVGAAALTQTSLK
jgi:hypothetical protein